MLIVKQSGNLSLIAHKHSYKYCMRLESLAAVTIKYVRQRTDPA